MDIFYFYHSVLPKRIALLFQKKHIQILRDKGFKGVIITDDLRMLVNAGYKAEMVIEKAFLAGNDILLCIDFPLNLEKIINILEKLSVDGKISESEVNERVERILILKLGRL